MTPGDILQKEFSLPLPSHFAPWLVLFSPRVAFLRSRSSKVLALALALLLVSLLHHRHPHVQPNPPTSVQISLKLLLSPGTCSGSAHASFAVRSSSTLIPRTDLCSRKSTHYASPSYSTYSYKHARLPRPRICSSTSNFGKRKALETNERYVTLRQKNKSLSTYTLTSVASIADLAFFFSPSLSLYLSLSSLFFSSTKSLDDFNISRQISRAKRKRSRKERKRGRGQDELELERLEARWRRGIEGSYERKSCLKRKVFFLSFPLYPHGG